MEAKSADFDSISSRHQLSAFDLDHTLINVNISYAFGKFLYKKGTHSLGRLLYSAVQYARHKLFNFPLISLHQSCCRALFQGADREQLVSAVDEFLDLYWSEILFAPAASRLKLAIDEGQYTVILSSSPDFLVEPISRRFNVDEWKATVYRMGSNQSITGVSSVLDGEAKRGELIRIAERLGIDIQQTVAYSDSHLDLPFLKTAGIAVGVTPSKSLRSICKQRDWEVLE